MPGPGELELNDGEVKGTLGPPTLPAAGLPPCPAGGRRVGAAVLSPRLQKCYTFQP